MLERDGPVVALVGPTAVGKSGAAMALADRLAAGSALEIVNADAMQLYRGMDIGTAKAGAADRARVPHHLLDLWAVTHRASVVEYRDAARDVLRAIGDRAVPVVVGGSGLYLSAALDDLQVPATDPAVRSHYEAPLAEQGAPRLHAELARRDPAAAAGIHPGNGRRIVRALEVVELAGSFRSHLPREVPQWVPTRWIGLRAEPALLDRAIGQRVDAMWAAGLAQEVVALLDRGLREGPTASKAVGYRECLAFLDGDLTRQEAIAATALRTRQLARRQMRWFRRDPRITWLDVVPGQPAAAVAERVAAVLAAPD